MEIPLLTKGESKVYKALVELGDTSIGNIIKISGVSHSKIYDILKRLSEKGLISSINNNGRQYFSPADPSRLLELVGEKENELQQSKEKIKDIVKTLKLRRNITNPKNILSSYEGIKGMKTVLEYVLDKLKKGEEVLILGTPRQINESIGGYIKEWQRRRIAIGAKCKIITDMNLVQWEYDWWKKSKRNLLTFTKKSSMNSPAYFVITKDLVITIYFSKNILSLIVEHQEIAERYKEFFEILWKQN